MATKVQQRAARKWLDQRIEEALTDARFVLILAAHPRSEPVVEKISSVLKLQKLPTHLLVQQYCKENGIENPLKKPKPKKWDRNANRDAYLRKIDGVIKGSPIRYLPLGLGYALYCGQTFLENCTSVVSLLAAARHHRKNYDQYQSLKESTK